MMDDAEFPPLLNPGFHEMNFEELWKMCVDEFPLSKTRDGIADGLEKMIMRLKDSGIIGTLWVNGSFLTMKIDPRDVDVLLMVDDNDYSELSSEQLEVIDWFESEDRKSSHYCDCYVSVEYQASHSQHDVGEWMRAYWIRQFGFSRGKELKGIVTIKIKE